MLDPGRWWRVRSMRTVDSDGNVDTAWGRLRRDAGTLQRIAGMVFVYATAGAKIRRRYHAKLASGGTYWVDEPGENEFDENAPAKNAPTKNEPAKNEPQQSDSEKKSEPDT